MMIIKCVSNFAFKRVDLIYSPFYLLHKILVLKFSPSSFFAMTPLTFPPLRGSFYYLVPLRIFRAFWSNENSLKLKKDLEEKICKIIPVHIHIFTRYNKFLSHIFGDITGYISLITLEIYSFERGITSNCEEIKEIVVRFSASLR